MRAAIYCRVSTDEQSKEGSSIEAQKALLERKAAEWDMTVIKHYIDDGYSAKDMKRPQLQQLLSDIQHNTLDVVIYWRLDRLTRNSKDFHKLTERLQKHNVGIKSATEPIDTTTAIGRFQLELSVSLAQLERETISERVFFVLEERVRKGLRNGAPAPLGYDLVDRRLVVNEEKAALIRRIYQMYVDGLGMKGIAHQLNQEGIASSYNKSVWSAPAVRYILQNPIYVGKLRWNYIDKSNKRTKREIIIDAEHEPIVDELLFERVQNTISRRKVGGKKFTNSYLFSSVLKCGRCGGTLHGMAYRTAKKTFHTYRCTNKIDHGTCDFHNIREDAVIDAFLATLDLSNVELEKYFQVPESTDEEQDRLQAIQRELETIARRKKKWQLAYGNDTITLEELKELTEEDRLREEFLKKQLESVPMQSKTYMSKEELIEQLRILRKRWDDIPNDKAKKMFIQEAYESITIDTDPDSKVGRGFRIRVVVTDFKFRI